MKEAMKRIFEQVAGLHDTPNGAYNLRADGKSIGSANTENITIQFKENGQGIDVYVKPHTKGEMVHIPVAISISGHQEMVYNDFHIGEGADITVIAGCGIHNDGMHLTQHDGIHSFYLEKDAKVVYVEKHYGTGEGTGERVLNPVTKVFLKNGSYLEMDTVQIKGVDSTKRVTESVVGENATLIVKEKLMTHANQYAQTEFQVDLNGKNSHTDIISRSVAQGNSKQIFLSKINGNELCMGHSECDAIIMDNASVQAIPEITANHVDASLIHEAAIGKIAGEQIIKLMSLGLTQEEAEREIINGFLK